MIYLDNGATSFRKPESVRKAVLDAMLYDANPGRGGYGAAVAAQRTVYRCRELAGKFFDCEPTQVVFTSNCTHGLNIAIRTLVKLGDHVVISGFEHNAVTRPLRALGAKISVAGRRLFDWENTLEEFEAALKSGANCAIFTHMSNVFGYILPVEQMCALCRKYGIPFIIDAAQSAGILPVHLRKWGADYIAMPGHKGLLGPQGTGLLLCGSLPDPLICGGTGSESVNQLMPDYLPDRGEAGTLNVPGIAGMGAGMQYLQEKGINALFQKERKMAEICARGLQRMGLRVFSGTNQGGTVSFLPGMDCEEMAELLAKKNIAVRAGLHCAPLAHESAGTLDTGTVRVSFGHDANMKQTEAFLRTVGEIHSRRK